MKIKKILPFMAKIQNRRMYIGYLNVSKNILCELSDVFTETCHTWHLHVKRSTFGLVNIMSMYSVPSKLERVNCVCFELFVISPLYFLRLIVNDCTISPTGAECCAREGFHIYHVSYI